MARALALSRIDKAVRLARGDDPPDDGLKPGNMRLYGYYTPSLEAGVYGIEAVQVVKAEGDNVSISNHKIDRNGKLVGVDPIAQKFLVVAPQFSLDPKLINSYYPPSAHLDEGRILPHIVFNDPHVPWYRSPSAIAERKWLTGPIDVDSGPTPDEKPLGARNCVPWMALLVFDPEELLVAEDESKALGIDQIQSPAPVYDSTKPPADGAYGMAVKDYLKTVKSRIWYEAGYDGPDDENWADLLASNEKTSVIFPKKDRLKVILGDETASETILESHKLQAHVRHINVVGCPDYGYQEEGYFSIVVSSMTGDVTTVQPKTQVVHLVSLEHYDSSILDAKSLFNTASASRAGIISLFSWTYTCIPQSINFVDVMQKLATNMQPLKPEQAILDQYSTPSANEDLNMAKARSVLLGRLNLGYTIHRWRTSSGEETVAFNRGPLTPSATPAVPAKDPGDTETYQDWPDISMSGKDYQILDRGIGIMDITYSAAWNLGKMIAISDSPFNAAVLRFRSTIYNPAASNTRKRLGQISSAKAILRAAAPALSSLHSLERRNFSGDVARINPPGTGQPCPPLSHPDVAPLFAANLQSAVDEAAKAGEDLFNEFNLAGAANSDWELIHKWISDCFYLSKVPAHYLLPEPTHINSSIPPTQSTPDATAKPSPEALRFFYIDGAWVDAFVDGALSVANHLEPKFDATRIRIKEVYNFYLAGNIKPTPLRPQIPKYGFILRSAVVKAVPDLRITVTCWIQKGGGWVEDLDDEDYVRRNPLLRTTRMDEFTILCLLDCLPEEIFQIVIAQPPHQQRFAFPVSVEWKEDVNEADEPKRWKVTVENQLLIKMLYTDTMPEPEGDRWPSLPGKDQYKPSEQAGFYNYETRCMDSMEVGRKVRERLATLKFDDPIVTSCLMGLELNDPAYELNIMGPTPSRSDPFPSEPRQLWVGARPSQPHGTIDPNNVETRPIPQPPPLAPSSIRLAGVPSGISNIPPLLTPPLLHSSPVIDRPTPSVRLPNNPIGYSPQFELLVHPDWRPPPPKPILQPNGSLLYAPRHYVPTKTAFLYDLLISIRRLSLVATHGRYKLQEIRIEIPVAADDGTEEAQKDSHGFVREPLLEAGGYAGSGVRMVSNPRFVSGLYNGLDEGGGPDGRGGMPVLGISLQPRSSRKDSAVSLEADGRTDEVSVRLGDVRVAAVVDKGSKVLVPQKVGPGPNDWANKMENRGVCWLRLVEKYIGPNGSFEVETNRKSQRPCVALKKDVGDEDLGVV